MYDWTWAGPAGMSKFHEVAPMPMVSTTAILPSLSHSVPVISWGVLYIHLQRKRRLGPGLQVIPHDVKASLESG